MSVAAGRIVEAELYTSARTAILAGSDTLASETDRTDRLGKTRIIRILEGCNVKLSSVLSDTQGVVGSKLVDKLFEGKGVILEDIEAVYHQRLQASKEELNEACNENYKHVLFSPLPSSGSPTGQTARPDSRRTFNPEICLSCVNWKGGL
jgi:hypothetical protein